MLTALWEVITEEWVHVLTEVLRWVVAGAIGGIVALTHDNQLRLLGALIVAIPFGFVCLVILRALEKVAERQLSEPTPSND